MSENDINIKHRHLPHWTIKYGIYFITSKIIHGEINLIQQLLIKEHIISGHKNYYCLIAAIVMKDHAHIILQPKPEYTLSNIMKGIKGVTARKINLLRGSSGSMWQDESYDRIIRDQKELDEKIEYMLMNPVRKGYTENPWNYPGWYFNENYAKELLFE